MKKTVILIVIFLFLDFITFSQIIISDTISWKPTKYYTIKNGNFTQKFYYLYFTGAVYQDAYFLPYYTKVIDLNQDAVASAKLIHAKFIPYTDKYALKAQSIIPEQPTLEAHVFKSTNGYKLIIKLLPIKSTNTNIYLLKSFTLKITLSTREKKYTGIKFSSSSIMASGHWVKIAIPKTGVYRISYDTLRSLGFSDPSKVRVFGNDFGQLPYYNYEYAPDDLKENIILHKNNYIYFFAKGANVWYYDTNTQMFLLKEHDYSDTAYYFLSDVNTGMDNNIKPTEQPQTYNTQTDYYDWLGFRGEALHNYLKSGRMWFDLDFGYKTSRSFYFKDNYYQSLPAKAKVVFMGRGYTSTSLTIDTEDKTQTLNFSPIPGLHGTDYGKVASTIVNFTPKNSSRIKITLTYNGLRSSSRGALDNITINAKRKLIFDKQLYFRNIDVVGTQKTTKFTIYNAPSDIIIWDVTEPTQPKQVSSHLDGNQAYFLYYTDKLKEFIAFTPNTAMHPILKGKFLGPIDNQNLHALSANTQMIIITYPDFLSSANQIAQVHIQHDHLNVKVVTTEQIYNEYSSGIPDAVAIRNFLRSVYIKPNSQLKWVLLFGDGSYKNKSDKNNPNFIPTYQTLNSLNTNGVLTITTDDFFGFLDNTEGETQGLLDINIGRIPVQTSEQGQLMADKIKTYLYNQAKNIWKANLAVVADDGENNLFMEQLENVTDNSLNIFPQFMIKKIYIDAYKAQILYAGEEYPQAVADITNSIEQGVLLLAYNGHGNEQVLSSERVITSSDVRNWHNMDRLTLMITATCLFGHFDNYNNSKKKDLPCGVEYGLFNPHGGLIASYATTRESYTITNYYMLNYFFQNIFSSMNNKKITISEAITKSKEQYPSYYNREFLYLGDPALSLAFPVEQIDNINIKPDTLKSLSQALISGYVSDNKGNIDYDFNGTMTIKILDKPQYYYTLNNDGFGAFRYIDYKNVIYSGQISVENGKFNFHFITPKDIDYSYGKGKIIYYATDGNKEYLGYKYIITGGRNDTIIQDKQGPEIRIFLNDTTVSSSTITDRNPKIIVYLKDQTGINTTNYGLGHQIQLILDNKQTYNLNQYFTYNKNTNNQGKAEYKLYKLSPGKHTITVKAFDVLNNFSEKTLEFTVTNQNNLIINRLFNFPNPFTTNTSFYFEHNQIDKPMYVILSIYTTSGKLVRQFSREMICNSFLSEPITWDGKDLFGNTIGRGVYLYILTVRLQSGETVKKVGKLLKI